MKRDTGMIVFTADHDQSFLDLIKAQLAPKGFLISSFTRGGDLVEALEEAAAAGGLPRVILLAAILPDRNGLELCKKIKEHRPFEGCKVAIMSAIHRSSRLAVDARTHFHADAYLTLPLDMKGLPEILQKIAAGEETAPPPEKRPVPKADLAEIFEDPGRKAGGESASDRPREPAEPVRRDRQRAEKREPVSDLEKEAKSKAGPLTPGKPAPAPSGVERRRALKPRAPTEGKLEEVLFPELLLALYQDRATGILSIQHRDEERRIGLRNGIPVSVDSNFIAGQSLGAILIEQERITRDQLLQAQREAADSGRRLGEVLVEQGFMDGQELMATLHFQAQKKLMSAFEHREGLFRFESASPVEGALRQLDESILRILLAGVKNYCTLAILESRIYGNKHRIIVKADYRHMKRAGLQLTSKEWAVLDLVNGRRTLGDIISGADLNFVRTFQVLYLFFLFGIIRFADEGLGFFQLDEPVMDRALAEARSETLRPVPAAQIAAEGDIDKGDLVRLLYRLNALRSDGVVTVKSDDAAYEIVLAGGKPVRISSEGISKLSIGNLLVDQSLITAVQRDEALAEAQGNGKPLGELLLGKGFISPHQLYGALVSQAEERLLALTQSGGPREIHYRAKTVDVPSQFPLDIDILKVLIAALRLRVSRDKMLKELAYHLRHYVNMLPAARERTQRNLSDVRESQLLSQMTGSKTFSEILVGSMLPREQTMSLVYALFRLGLIEFLSE